jgi:hypothetical protein
MASTDMTDSPEPADALDPLAKPDTSNDVTPGPLPSRSLTPVYVAGGIIAALGVYAFWPRSSR